jgi:hypothetical protein
MPHYSTGHCFSVLVRRIGKCVENNYVKVSMDFLGKASR